MTTNNDRTLLLLLPFGAQPASRNETGNTLTPPRPLGQRARAIGRSVARAAGRLLAYVQAQRRTSLQLRQLRELDARTLQELGLTRAEFASVVAEAEGDAELTRRRIEKDWIAAASSGLRVRHVDTCLSLAAFISFGGVLIAAALTSPLLPLA
jgi:uncharacterized protein YjiS (DUF1127 family)